MHLLRADLRTFGDDLHISLEIDSVAVSKDIQVQLAMHDDVTVAWCATIPLTFEGGAWSGVWSNYGRNADQKLLEITRVASQDELVCEIASRQLFMEPPGNGLWVAGEAAEMERARLEAKREAYYCTALEAEGASYTSPEYYVIAVADNLLLTQSQRVPGMTMVALQNATLGSDTCEVLNAILLQRGFASVLDPNSWIERMQRRRPSVAIEFRKVRAASAEQAAMHCQGLCRRMLDLMTLRRGAPPRLLAGVVGEANNQGMFDYRGSWIEGSEYTGNLLGGFISGEDPHSLQRLWNGSASHPRAQLLAALYSDAIADSRWDYRLFRCFNLLEGVATDFLSSKQTIVDVYGAPRLQPTGRPYTTDQARGKVYALLEYHAQVTTQAPSNFSALQSSSIDQLDILWEEVGIWVAVRNDVAHTGAWRGAFAGETAGHVQARNSITARSHDGTFDSGRNPVVSAIRRAAEGVIYSVINGTL